MDYGRSLEFGLFPIPEASGLGQIYELTDVADRLGLDFIGVQDHPYQRRFLDTLSLISALAARMSCPSTRCSPGCVTGVSCHPG